MAYKRISPQPVVEGGTGASTLTDHSVLIGSGTGAITAVGPVGSTGAVLMSNGVGSDPGFSTATYPLTTTANQILYSSATNTVSEITTSANGVLITNNSSVPSLLAAGTTGQVLTATTGAAPSWAAASGDVSGPGSSTDRAIATWNGTGGTDLYDNSTITISSAGEMVNTAQPAFLATATAQSNVTGDGTAYTVTFTSEIFDQNSDFDGTSTFTAPVTGRYNLSTIIYGSGITSSMTVGSIKIVTGNRNYQYGVAPSKVFDSNTNASFIITSLCDMDAMDTAVVTIQFSSGTKVADILATISTFSGSLIC